MRPVAGSITVSVERDNARTQRREDAKELRNNSVLVSSFSPLRPGDFASSRFITSTEVVNDQELCRSRFLCREFAQPCWTSTIDLTSFRTLASQPSGFNE